jgi:hypothetical protein
MPIVYAFSKTIVIRREKVQIIFLQKVLEEAMLGKIRYP